MDPTIELRQLRYFIAVAEELHFGRAAERLHMSQSPLSRAIRDLERQLDVVLFVRTTRRVELTPAGGALLERARKAVTDVDAAIDEARRASRPEDGVLVLGHGPLSRAPAARLAEAVRARRPQLTVRLEEGVTADLLGRVAGRELAGAAVMQSPAAARRYRVQIHPLRDEPLLAALPAAHRHVKVGAIPLETFVAECVLLPREPPGALFNAWLRAVLRTAGVELERTMETLSAPWDRRMLPVARGEAVSVVVHEWADEPIPGIATVPFDPPVTLPIDLASAAGAEDVAAAALRLRDEEGWLTSRRPRAAGFGPDAT
jgi:DNA-binding transcriptional LysR family regulator